MLLFIFQIRVGVIMFATRVYESIPLGSYSTKSDLIEQIHNISQARGLTFTNMGLDKMLSGPFASGTARKGVQK